MADTTASAVRVEAPGGGARPDPGSASLIAAVAVAGQLLLLGTAWLLPAFSEYELFADSISELALGQFGLVLTAGFVAAGAGTLGLAVLLRRLTAGSRGSLVGTVLIGVYGAGAIHSAVFPTDRIDAPADVWTQSTVGTLHAIVALVSFASVVIGMFVLSTTFRRIAAWRSLGMVSALLAGGALSLVFVQQQSPLVGLLQRALVTIVGSWIIMVALRARAVATGRR